MSAKNRIPGRIPDHVRRHWEDDTRRRLSDPAAEPSSDPSLAVAARANLAYLKALERAYLEDRNPVDAWEGIAQVYLAWNVLGGAAECPPWIMAYLFQSALGISRVADLQPGNRHVPVKPTLNPDGSTTYYGDSFRGVTARQRLEMAMEDLGFRGTKGANPFVRAYRDRMASERVTRIDAELRRGQTTAEAIRSLKDPDLRIGEPRRKVRRDRKRLRRRR